MEAKGLLIGGLVPALMKGALMSGGVDLAWALGTWLVAVGLSRYAAPLAKIVPCTT